MTEGQSVTIIATLSDTLASSVTIPLTTVDHSAEAADRSTLANITIPANAERGTGTIQTNHDADDEDEAFTVALGTLPSSVVAGSPSSAGITILDDEVPHTVKLSVTPNPAPENSRVSIRAVLSRPAGRDVSIRVQLLWGKGVENGQVVEYGTLDQGDLEGGMRGKVRITEHNGKKYAAYVFPTWVRVNSSHWGMSGTRNVSLGEGAKAGEDFTVRLDTSHQDWPSGIAAGDPSSVKVAIGEADPPRRDGGTPGQGDDRGAPELLDYILVHYDGDPPVDDFFHHANATRASYGYRARIPGEFPSRDPDQGVVQTTHAKLKIFPAESGTTIRAGKVTYDSDGNRNVTLQAVTGGELSHGIELNANNPVTNVDIEVTHDGVTITYLLSIDPPPRTYSLSPSARVVEGQEAALTLTLGRPAPEGGVEFTVTASYGSAGSGDVGEIASPVTVPQGGSELQILVPTVDDDQMEEDENFQVTVAPVRAGWGVAPVGTDTATVTIEDNDAAGQQGGDEDEDNKYAELITQMYEWRNDPQWKEYKAHTDRWDRALLAFGETVSDATLTPLTAAEAQGYADRGWTRWVEVAAALRELENQAPTVPAVLSDATIVNENGAQTVSLSGVFSDADNDVLTITAASSDEAVATVSIAADQSSLTVDAQARGEAAITVTANDGKGGVVSDTFTVTVKAAPVVSSAISDLTGLEVNATQEVSLSGVFSDADNDALTITAASSDNAVATVTVAADRSKLTLTGVAEGTATITVTAQDADGNRTSDTFDVTITAPQQQDPANQAPTVSSAIADATIVSESGTKQVSLAGVFSDAESDALTITVASSDEGKATVSVAADYSSLTLNARARGTTTVTVTADDGNGGTVSDTFTVRVKAAPVVASGIGDVSGLDVDATQDVSLSGVFSDADGDSLTITAASSAESKATVSVASDGSRLTLTGVAEGTATITVAARDSDGNTVSDTFDVSVVKAPDPEQEPPPQDDPPTGAPTVAAPLADLSLEAPGQREISLSGVFHDPDGDDLTITAASSNYGVASMWVAGSTLTVVATGKGTATITVTAEDPDGNRVSDEFEVTVRPAS